MRYVNNNTGIGAGQLYQAAMHAFEKQSIGYSTITNVLGHGLMGGGVGAAAGGLGGAIMGG